MFSCIKLIFIWLDMANLDTRDPKSPSQVS